MDSHSSLIEQELALQAQKELKSSHEHEKAKLDLEDRWGELAKSFIRSMPFSLQSIKKKLRVCTSQAFPLLLTEVTQGYTTANEKYCQWSLDIAVNSKLDPQRSDHIIFIIKNVFESFLLNIRLLKAKPIQEQLVRYQDELKSIHGQWASSEDVVGIYERLMGLRQQVEKFEKECGLLKTRVSDFLNNLRQYQNSLQVQYDNHSNKKKLVKIIRDIHQLDEAYTRCSEGGFEIVSALGETRKDAMNVLLHIREASASTRAQLRRAIHGAGSTPEVSPIRISRGFTPFGKEISRVSSDLSDLWLNERASSNSLAEPQYDYCVAAAWGVLLPVIGLLIYSAWVFYKRYHYFSLVAQQIQQTSSPASEEKKESSRCSQSPEKNMKKSRSKKNTRSNISIGSMLQDGQDYQSLNAPGLPSTIGRLTIPSTSTSIKEGEECSHLQFANSGSDRKSEAGTLHITLCPAGRTSSPLLSPPINNHRIVSSTVTVPSNLLGQASTRTIGQLRR